MQTEEAMPAHPYFGRSTGDYENDDISESDLYDSDDSDKSDDFEDW